MTGFPHSPLRSYLALEPRTDKQTVNWGMCTHRKAPIHSDSAEQSLQGGKLDSKSSRAAVRSGYRWRKLQGRRTYTEMKGVACGRKEAI